MKKTFKIALFALCLLLALCLLFSLQFGRYDIFCTSVVLLPVSLFVLHCHF